jgi:outer membrane protein assembly factor BamB
MKKLLIAAMFISTSLMAQDDELPVVWEGEFENKAKVLSICNGDGSLLIGSDPNEATGMDASGKVTWSGKYKTINGDGGAGESEYQYVYWGPDLLFLFDKKAGKDRVSVVDVKTGKGLWNSNEYSGLGEDNIDYIAEMDAFMFCMKSANVLVDARTGRKIWETSIFKGSVGKYIYFPSTKEMLMINYKPTWLSALFSGFKNQLVRINATNGNVIWDVEYRGIVEKEVLTRKPIVDIDVKGDKIFLQLDGLQVFDFQNGKEIWSAVYESDQGVRTNFLEPRSSRWKGIERWCIWCHQQTFVHK